MHKGIKREVVTVVLLSIFTCGIYYLYWIYATSKEVSEAMGEPVAAGTELLLSIITCGIYAIYWIYKTSKKIQEMQRRQNLPAEDNSVLLIVLAIFSLSIVSIAIMQDSLNKLWDSM